VGCIVRDRPFACIRGRKLDPQYQTKLFGIDKAAKCVLSPSFGYSLHGLGKAFAAAAAATTDVI
jgi:hypothetical protein